MSEQIKIILGPGARTSTLETSGFKGTACEAASEVFKKHLGQVQVTENTAEMYEASACQIQQEN